MGSGEKTASRFESRRSVNVSVRYIIFHACANSRYQQSAWVATRLRENIELCGKTIDIRKITTRRMHGIVGERERSN